MAQVHDMLTGDLFEDRKLIQKLTATDPIMSHWMKGRTDVYSDTHAYEIHFYYNVVTRLARFDIDFKLRFQDTFSP